jgi:hypothetical protein
MTGIIAIKKMPFVMKEDLLKYYFLRKKDEVVLSTGGITFLPKPFNGQVIFTNLAEGTYIVGWWKF